MAGPSTLAPMRWRVASACAVLLTAPAWAACSLTAGTPTVSADVLEDQISTRLEAEVGTRPEAVECPGGLTGKVGATQDCVLTHGEDRMEVLVTVTEVDDTDVRFSIEVESEDAS